MYNYITKIKQAKLSLSSSRDEPKRLTKAQLAS